MPTTIAGDRLYGLSFRPHELALYGDRVSFALRYAPMCDDPAATAAAHYKVLVLEVVARPEADDELARQGQRELLVAKCGWELELACDPPCPAAALTELPGELPLLLERIADTLNDLARRAGMPPPMGVEVVTHLLHRYRTSGVGG